MGLFESQKPVEEIDQESGSSSDEMVQRQPLNKKKARKAQREGGHRMGSTMGNGIRGALGAVGLLGALAFMRYTCCAPQTPAQEAQIEADAETADAETTAAKTAAAVYVKDVIASAAKKIAAAETAAANTAAAETAAAKTAAAVYTKDVIARAAKKSAAAETAAVNTAAAAHEKDVIARAAKTAAAKTAADADLEPDSIDAELLKAAGDCDSQTVTDLLNKGEVQVSGDLLERATAAATAARRRKEKSSSRERCDLTKSILKAKLGGMVSE